MYIRSSTFRFNENELSGISIHAADLENMKLNSDIGYRSTIKEIKEKYADKNVSQKSEKKIVAEIDEDTELEFYFFEGKMISIKTRKEN